MLGRGLGSPVVADEDCLVSVLGLAGLRKRVQKAQDPR